MWVGVMRMQSYGASHLGSCVGQSPSKMPKPKTSRSLVMEELQDAQQAVLLVRPRLDGDLEGR